MFLLKLGIHPWFGDFFFFFPTKWRVTCLSSQIFTLCGYSLRFVSGDLDRSWQFLLLKGTQYQIFYSWINNARPLLAFDYQRAALATFDRRTRANSWIVQTSSAWTVSVLSFRKVTCHSTVQRSSCQDLLKKKNKEDWKRWDSCYLMAVFLGCFWLKLRSVPWETVLCWCSVGRKALVSLHECLPSYRDESEPLHDTALSRPAQPSFTVTAIECFCVFCPPSSADPGCHLMRF